MCAKPHALFSVVPKMLGRLGKRVARRVVPPLEPVATRLVVEPWWIDTVTVSLDERGTEIVTLTGWALQDPALSLSETLSRFNVNGQAPLRVDYPLSRPDVQKVFWQRPGAAASGFRIDA